MYIASRYRLGTGDQSKGAGVYIRTQNWILRLLLVPAASLLVSCGAESPTSNPTVPTPVATQTTAATGREQKPTPAAIPTQAAVASSVPTPLAPVPPTSGAPAPTPTSQPTVAAAMPTELPLTPEQNPVGDIPDTQAFVQYQSQAGGYALDVPEGWARTTTASDAGFVDKFNGVKVAITQTAVAPTAATAGTVSAALIASGRAVQIGRMQDVQLPGGPAVLIEYTANSDPNPVTGKQVRLELASYLFFQKGKLATLTLWAPLGADNVDQWQRMAHSFRWL